MTNQEAFTKVIIHLRTQGHPAIDKDKDVCVYRHPNGIDRCAIGILIPDEEYKSDFEGELVGKIYSMVPSFQNLDINLLTILQYMHDSSSHKGFNIEWPKEIEIEFLYIAQKYNLHIPH